MGQYVDVDFVTHVYSGLSKVGSSSINSYHIPFAERKVEGMLSTHFSVPFSDNNLTVKELVTDAVYIKIGNLSNEEAQEFKEQFEARIEGLKTGQEFMVTTSGDTLTALSGTVWSTTEDYFPVFGLGPTEYFEVDSSLVYDEEVDRGNI